MKHGGRPLNRRILFLLALATPATGALAHEVRPAYLELRETQAGTHEVLWKVPARGDDLRLGLYVELPGTCSNVTPPRASLRDGAFTERWIVHCEGGLSGGTIHVSGLSATMTDALVRLERTDGSTQVARLTPAAPSFVVAAPHGAMGVARAYTGLGIEHILSGIDHLLFVLALILITGSGWKLVKTVTAFTVSHGITLTLATLGYVHVPVRPTEAVIALSIVFVAAEILHGQAGRQGLTARAPWIVAFVFGLMHGLGFAGGLSEAGLPEGHIPTALIFFSIGVEAGHFLFIAVVVAILALARRVARGLSDAQRQRVGVLRKIPAYAIGTVAMSWVIQRIAAF